jgi:hypothetical protein
MSDRKNLGLFARHLSDSNIDALILDRFVGKATG